MQMQDDVTVISHQKIPVHLPHVQDCLALLENFPLEPILKPLWFHPPITILPCKQGAKTS